MRVIAPGRGSRKRSAIQQAHGHPTVLKLWEQYSAVCDYVPLTEVPEAANLFSEFAPVTVHA